MVANVLIGIGGQDVNLPPEAAARYQKTIENVKNTYKEKLLKNAREDFAVGSVEFVSTRSEVDTFLSKGRFDIFLCTDKLSGDKEGIGIGTIRQWQNKYPNVHTFLLLEPKRDKETGKLLNTGKLANLYLEGYYVAFFVNEILANEEEFFNTLIHGRTKEEAYRYYELNDEIVGRILETKIRKKPEPVDVASIKEVEVVLNDSPEEEITEEITSEVTESEPVMMEEPDEVEEVVEESHQSNLFEEIPEDAGDYEEDEVEDDMQQSYESEDYNEEYSYSPRVYLDLEALKATATYSFGGVIGEVISDDVLIIRCPGGGLFRNKDSLKNHKIEIVIRDL